MSPDDSRLRGWSNSVLAVALGGCVQTLHLIASHEDLQSAEMVDLTLMLWRCLPRNARIWKLRAQVDANDWPLIMNYAVARYTIFLDAGSKYRENRLSPSVHGIVGREPARSWVDTALAHLRQDLARDEGDNLANTAHLAGAAVLTPHQFFGYERIRAEMPWIPSIALVMQTLTKLVEAPFQQVLSSLVASCIRHFLYVAAVDNGDKWIYLALKQHLLYHLARAGRWLMSGSTRTSMLKDVASETVESAIIPHLFHLPILRVVATSLKRIRTSSENVTALQALLGKDVMGKLENIVDDWEPLTRGIKDYTFSSVACHNLEVQHFV
jgi:hypothetical protein